MENNLQEIKDNIQRILKEKKNLEEHIDVLKRESAKIQIYNAEIKLIENKINIKEKLLIIKLKKISEKSGIPEPIIFTETEPHYVCHWANMQVNDPLDINVKNDINNEMLDPIDITKKDYENICKQEDKYLGLYYHHKSSPDIAHQTIHANQGFPIRYAPWINDEEFKFVYHCIKDYSLLDLYRMYDLYLLAKQSEKVNGCILEVGVANGGSGTLLSYIAKTQNKICYLADTWTGVVKVSDKDTTYKGGEFSYANQLTVYHLLSTLDTHKNTVLLPGIFPDDTADKIDCQVSMMHVDVDTYDSCKDIIEWAIPKLSIGGIIVFDDYGFLGLEGVTRFANEFSKDPRFIYSYNLNGHATFVKIRD